MRPSHGRPRGHRPIIRPSENVRVTTMPGRSLLFCKLSMLKFVKKIISLFFLTLSQEECPNLKI
jgi:hypothetical protein